MGYEIRYENFAEPRRRTSRHSLRLPWLTAAFFLTFLLLTQAFWPEGRAKLREFFLPGDPEVTAQAAATLASDLRGGESFSDAVSAFCREILEHAEYTP